MPQPRLPVQINPNHPWPVLQLLIEALQAVGGADAPPVVKRHLDLTLRHYWCWPLRGFRLATGGLGGLIEDLVAEQFEAGTTEHASVDELHADDESGPERFPRFNGGSTHDRSVERRSIGRTTLHFRVRPKFDVAIPCRISP